MFSHLVLILVFSFFALLPASPTQAATLPTGFVETLFASTLSNPTAMEFAPDGRLFVAQQGGALRVIENGNLLSTPFVTLSVNSTGERGLLGVAFDPNFASNHFVYVYYTTSSAPIHNRVSRFTANGNVAVAGSEVVIMELENLTSATNHNGGAIHFGPDGKLYVAVGENANGANAQDLANRLGKILRINSDGSNPSDNPFVGVPGTNSAIWAYGLRNPFTFAFQPGTGRMFINDVGAGSWEEINDGIAGANYGWPATEGETSNPGFVSPLFAYPHGSGNTSGCAIAGGAFYNPLVTQFPVDYVGDYFFADLCNDWIRRYDVATDSAIGFATSATDGLVDLKVGSDGSLYYLARGGGSSTGVVYRVQFAPPNLSGIGIYNPPDGRWFLRDTPSSGSPNWMLQYGGFGTPVVGDWNGDSADTIGIYNPANGFWYLRDSNSNGSVSYPPFAYGGFGVPVVGDWNGDGVDTVGIYNPANGFWYLRNSNSSGSVSYPPFAYGGFGVPVVGDWNGDGVDTVGIYNPASGLWYLRNSNSSGSVSYPPFAYGGFGVPVVGDWNGDGADTIGIYNPANGLWYLRNSINSGSPNYLFQYGGFGIPVVGLWSGSSASAIGLMTPFTGDWEVISAQLRARSAPSATQTVTATFIPTSTPGIMTSTTASPIPTLTPSATISITMTFTATGTIAPSLTPTSAPTATATQTNTSVPPTATPVPPTDTVVPTATFTETPVPPTATPVPPTDTVVPTATFTETPIPAEVTPAV
jgi:glucose/arabinose dehydrogenase